MDMSKQEATRPSFGQVSGQTSDLAFGETPGQAFKQALEKAQLILKEADRVLIGAGAGLSTAAGFEYGGARFRENFAAFIERYGVTDMYTAGFYPFPSEADRWAFWAHHAWINCVDAQAAPLYRQLLEWARTKDYFVITTNVDRQFEKAGFDPERLFVPQGDFEHIQCSRGCHQKVYDATDLFQRMEEDTSHGQRTRLTDESLVPKCPVCGGHMEMHVRCDDSFVQNEKWHDAQERYNGFVAGMRQHRTVLLELGVGWNTPVWIRMPFEQMAAKLESPLVRMNLDDARVNPNLPCAVGIPGDMAQTLPAVL